MMKKLVLVTGVAVGYVLGARAGREQYDKIVEQATSLWRNPKVQEQVATAQQTVKEQAPVAAEKVSDATKSAVGQTKDAASRDTGANDGGSGI